MAKEQPFRSIEMRGRQSSVRSDLRAPDRTKQMAELARQEKQRVQSSHEALNAARRFENFNQQVVDDVAIQQQRLEAANLSTNSRLAAKANEILGRQELENERLRIQQEDQVRRMQNSQEIIRNQLQQQFSAQEAKSLSNFGNQLLNFSETLYKQKAEEINEANQRLQAQGQLDGMLKARGLNNQTIDLAQTSRATTGMRLDNEARQLDSEGKPNDATNLRSHNGFYTHGMQEGIAIANAYEFKGYLQKAKEEAIAAGVLQFGEPNADQKLQLFLQNKTIDFLVERGLVNLPPEIQNKYLAKTLIVGQLEVFTEFNDANQKYTLDASIGLVRNQIRTASKSSEFAADLPNMLGQLFTKDPENFSKNLGKVFQDLKADSYESGDMTSLDTLVTIIKSDDRLLAAGQDVISDYLKYEQTFDKAQSEAANAAAQEQLDNLKASFQVQAADIQDVTVLTQLRADYMAQAQGLPLKQRGALLSWLNDQGAASLDAVKNSNDFFLSQPGATPENIDARIDANPGMPDSEKDRLRRARDAKLKLKATNPLYENQILMAKASIEGLRPTVEKERLTLDPQIKDKINAAVRLRQKQLDLRFNAWVTDGIGEKNAETMKAWLDNQIDLLKDPIALTDEGDIPELSLSSFEFEAGAEKAVKFKTQPIGNTSRNGVFFTGKESRARARSGALGRLDSSTGVFLNPPEIVAAVNKYETDGLIEPLVRDLAIQAGVTPKTFLEEQAKLWGMPGSIQPFDPQIKVSPVTKTVSMDDAFNFAINEGLGRGGAIMFANSMMMESSGNPLAEHDPDENGKPTGFGLFGHRESRWEALEKFAADRGKNPKDPTVQMQYAISELRAYKDHPYFGDVYATVFSENPEPKQLVLAQRKWLRFAESLHGFRKKSLENDLSNY